MKTLKLKKLSNLDYKTNLLGMLKTAPAKGFSIDEVRKSVKAIEVLEKAKEQAEFEDDVCEHIKKVVATQKFVIASKELVEFIDDIEKV